MARDWHDQLCDAAAQAHQNTGETIGAVRDYSSSLGERAVDAAGRTRRQTADTASQMREAAKAFVSDQPLLCAALGIAVGTGGAIYRYAPSRREARWEWLSVGSAAAAIAWLGSSILSSWYVANFGAYNRLTGPWARRSA